MKKILFYALTTEKAIRMIEAENKIIFVVDRRAKKPEIAKAVEKTFNVKVKSVRTSLQHNKKIAFIKLKPETPAIDIATRLGIV